MNCVGALDEQIYLRKLYFCVVYKKLTYKSSNDVKWSKWCNIQSGLNSRGKKSPIWMGRSAFVGILHCQIPQASIYRPLTPINIYRPLSPSLAMALSQYSCPIHPQIVLCEARRLEWAFSRLLLELFRDYYHCPLCTYNIKSIHWPKCFWFLFLFFSFLIFPSIPMIY